MNSKNKSMILCGNIDQICRCLEKYSEDFKYLSELIDFYSADHDSEQLS